MTGNSIKVFIFSVVATAIVVFALTKRGFERPHMVSPNAQTATDPRAMEPAPPLAVLTPDEPPVVTAAVPQPAPEATKAASSARAQARAAARQAAENDRKTNHKKQRHRQRDR